MKDQKVNNPVAGTEVHVDRVGATRLVAPTQIVASVYSLTAKIQMVIFEFVTAYRKDITQREKWKKNIRC